MSVHRFEPVKPIRHRMRDDLPESPGTAGRVRRLQALAMDGGSLRDAACLLANWCQGDILIRDPAGRTLARAESTIDAFDRLAQEQSRNGTLVYEKPLMRNGQLQANLTLSLSREAGRTGIELIDAAVPPLLLILEHGRLDDLARRREALLHDLLLGRHSPGGATLEQAVRLGIDWSVPHAVCLFRIAGRPVPGAIDGLYDAVREAWAKNAGWPNPDAGTGEPLLARLPDGLYQLFRDDRDSTGPEALSASRDGHPVEAACCRLKESLANTAPAPFNVGIGRSRSDTAGIAISCLEARRALETGERIHGGTGIYPYEAYACESILSQLVVDDEICLLVESELGTLLDGDPKSQLLLATLEALLSGPNHQDMASRLLVHPKTITHRKLTIERLIGRSLDDAGTRQRLSLALSLYRLNRGLWPGKGSTIC